MKKIIRKILIISLLLCAISFYAFKIEPYMIQVKSYRVRVERLADPVRIVQISDIEISDVYGVDYLEKVVQKVNALNPDIVVFTGDLYANYWKYAPCEAVMSSLKKLNENSQKYAVWGNNDYGGGAVRVFENEMEALGFTLLKNESEYLMLKGASFFIAGSDDLQMGQPDVEALTKAKTEDATLSILLAHNPEIVDQLKKNDFDIILSGHTHGGQVNLPIINKWLHKDIPFLSGLYVLEEIGGSQLYVSNGLGMSRFPIRFLAPPQIVVIDISGTER